MVNLKNLKSKLLLTGFVAGITKITMALSTSTLAEGTMAGQAGAGGSVGGGINTLMNYLTYTLWAMSALGIIAVGFMMLFQVQETILKNVMKVVGVICVIALAFSAPGWFGLNIIA